MLVWVSCRNKTNNMNSYLSISASKELLLKKLYIDQPSRVSTDQSIRWLVENMFSTGHLGFPPAGP